jgi:hypothetical protein
MKIIAKGPKYFSPGDEAAFFSWLMSIGCVENVTGELRDLHIKLKRRPTAAQLRELVALFFRYRMNMKPLAALRTPTNENWFYKDTNAFWHSRVFA